MKCTATFTEGGAPVIILMIRKIREGGGWQRGTGGKGAGLLPLMKDSFLPGPSDFPKRVSTVGWQVRRDAKIPSAAVEFSGPESRGQVQCAYICEEKKIRAKICNSNKLCAEEGEKGDVFIPVKEVGGLVKTENLVGRCRCTCEKLDTVSSRYSWRVKAFDFCRSAITERLRALEF